MKSIKLIVLGFEMLPNNTDGKVAVVITRPSKDNPSEKGTHTLNEGQLRRICLRTLGVYNPIALKHFIKLSANGAIMTIDAEDCKEGDSFEKANGEKGIYTKNWTKYSNHAIELSTAATLRLGELSIQASFADAAAQFGNAPVVRKAPVAVEEEKEEEPKV